MTKPFLLTFLLLLTQIVILGQEEYAIADGETVTTCFGTFVDDGTEGPYSGAEHTFTICPDVPGDVVQIYFIGFDLQTSPNPNNSDVLNIYQGDDTSAPYAGSYFGDDLAGLTITGSTSNLTGCLTFEFISPTNNTGGNAGWIGNISCTTPCDAPTQNSTIQTPAPPVAGLDSVSICIGDEVTFSGSGSSAAPGFTIGQYIWNFDDGSESDTLSGITASHTFNEAGEFLVSLTVEDNNGCQSLNVTPLQIIVSTLPDVQIDYPNETCIGETITLGATAEGVTWTALPPQVVAGETYLADDLGFDFESTLTFDFFEPDATLENCDDLLQININMVHSYLGDLEMIIECPDGTSVVLHEFGSGGGGTYLGEANDPGVAPGVGYDYGWSPLSTMGFFYENSNWTSVSYTNADGDAETNNIVNPGIYQSQEDLCDLVGCPLNGTWTFIVTDNLGIDDGYIFEWGIDLNPELFPGVTTFTPIWGQGADSSAWDAGQFITSISDDANTITVEPTEPGTYDYTYTTSNDFGCSYDTTVTITVLDPLQPNAGDDAEINCEEPYQLNVFLDTQAADDCVYELVLLDTWGNGWFGGEVELIVDGTSSFYTLTDADGVSLSFDIPVNHESTIEIIYTPGGVGATQDPSQNEYILFNANGDVVFSDGEFGTEPTSGLAFNGLAFCYPPEPPLSYSWTPVENLNNPSAQNPTVNGLVETTTFTVEVWQPNHPDCRFTDEVTLFVSGALEAGTDLALCAMQYQLDATDIPNGEWTAPAGTDVVFQNPTSHNTIVSATTPGVYELTWTDLDGTSCPTSSTIEVSFFDGIDIDATVTEPFCFGECTGEILVTGANGNVNPPLADYTYVFSAGTEGATPNEALDLCYGTYTVTLKDNDSCATSIEVFVDQPPAPIIDSVATTRESCLGACDGELIIYSPVAENYSFDGGDTFQSDSVNNTLCGGFYEVVIADPNGCEGSAEALVASPTPPEALFAADPVRTGIFDPLITFTNFSENNIFNDWMFGIENNVGTSEEEHPFFLFPTVPDIYTVQLVITDSIGCTDSTRVDIEIMDEFQLFVPTAFSPNDDGINDIFRLEIQNLDPVFYTFQVFDRWGTVVFETNEYPTLWNGQGPSEEEYYVPDGTYIWRIQAKPATATDRIEKMGMITIVR
ncbi:MAG: PKD domain-containing protein [Flavobacteriales bacterium]|nr:PKD domain-containing protein [Flavobacteriales bacterium]